MVRVQRWLAAAIAIMVAMAAASMAERYGHGLSLVVRGAGLGDISRRIAEFDTVGIREQRLEMALPRSTV